MNFWMEKSWILDRYASRAFNKRKKKQDKARCSSDDGKTNK